eukprot:TRINITY_DN62753_c0_g1_i1.p1 TRINITY_DN62753_c0_g1~~TRINITY_DN62753_c0_g1_i1.p1  ORF type:complete len:618 (+),score=130.08 TRINITY_DN62753_c0_g1_i1:330-2183(+)
MGSLEIMYRDDGGRRVEAVGLRNGHVSPQRTLESLGSTAFAEPQSVTRHEAEFSHAAEDKRQERHDRGHVLWHTESRIPDVGGLGWRTKTGHLLKNQAYFTQLSNVNKWDLPTHAGVNTWKEWHGPKMRTDADMMERLDRFDNQTLEQEAKKTFVNTMRVQTLDRFYNRKLVRNQLESSTSWAPHLRGRREVHSMHEQFDSDFASRPQKELKKVMTDSVLQKDRDGIRRIADRIQNEETWKMVWKQMEQERRADIRADLQMRQTHTDMLMQLSGQPLRASESTHSLPNNCSERTESLARPKLEKFPKDVTRHTDFRGLVHADEQHALEALFPGYGHELSVEFRENTTRSCAPGWPKPHPRADTPVRNTKKTREQIARGESVAKHAIPASEPRLENLGARGHNDQVLKEHSKVQFLTNAAPPPPNQQDILLTEDWSPSTSLRDPGRVTGEFSRTKQFSATAPTQPAKSTTVGGQAMGHAPPPTKPFVYPMLASSSPRAKPQGFNIPPPSQRTSPKASPSASLLRGGVSEPLLLTSTSAAATLTSGGSSPFHGTAFFRETARAERAAGQATAESRARVRAVCDELDDFDAKIQKVPRLSNFFSQAQRRGSVKEQTPTAQ